MEERLNLTVDSIRDVVGLLSKYKDPLEEYMIEHGFSPKLGGRLYWPASVSVEWGPFGPPYYVRITKLVEHPTMSSY